MKPALPTMVVAVVLAGCLGPDAQDRLAATKFRIYPDKSFTYTASAVVEPGRTLAETPPLEERWLRDWLADNQMCPNGYRIVQTTGARTGAMTLSGSAWYVADFTGHCL